MLGALGRTIARRARWFLLGWSVLIVGSFLLAGGALGTEGLFARMKGSDAPQVSGESRDGQQLLARATPTGPAVLLLLDRVDAASPAVEQAVTSAQRRLAALPEVAQVRSPFPARDPGAAGFVATDRRAVLVSVQLRQGAGPDAVAGVSRTLAEVGPAVPGSLARVGGLTALVREINDQVETDLRTGEAVSLPLSLLLMVLVFGGLIAAGLPIVGAIAAIGGALACLLGFSHVIDLDGSVVSVVSVLGLGLCIDYGLLLVSRYREELRALPADADPAAALERTLAVAGRTIAFSGVTVAISLSGLLFFHATILRAVGAAGVCVVLVAVAVALTLVPALLAVAGGRLVRPGAVQRLPGVSRLARRLGDVAPEQGRFSALATAVQRRPLLVVAAVAAVLLLAAAPALGMRMISSGAGLLPPESGQRQLFEAVDQRFPAVSTAPIRVVTAAGDAAELQRWARSLAGRPGVAAVDPLQVLGAGPAAVAVVGVRPVGGVDAPQARDLVDRLRADRPAVRSWVTGQVALTHDFLADIRSRAPLAVGVVVLATFALLFLMTGSVLVPVKALLMNLVSLGASFGVLVWLFQDGHLSGVLGFEAPGGIETTIPALVLAFGFGLAMDYEVFLLARIRELRLAGADNDVAVRDGLQASGRIITSAAAIVVIVFAGFAAGDLLVVKETGAALAVAVLVDATLVRMLLVPATMTLLGEWNWWAPAPLRRLHQRFGLAERA